MRRCPISLMWTPSAASRYFGSSSTLAGEVTRHDLMDIHDIPAVLPLREQPLRVATEDLVVSHEGLPVFGEPRRQGPRPDRDRVEDGRGDVQDLRAAAGRPLDARTAGRPGTSRTAPRRTGDRCRRSCRNRRRSDPAWSSPGRGRAVRAGRGGGTAPPACPGSESPETVSLGRPRFRNSHRSAGSRSRKSASTNSMYLPLYVMLSPRKTTRRTPARGEGSAAKADVVPTIRIGSAATHDLTLRAGPVRLPKAMPPPLEMEGSTDRNPAVAVGQSTGPRRLSEAARTTRARTLMTSDAYPRPHLITMGPADRSIDGEGRGIIEGKADP